MKVKDLINNPISHGIISIINYYDNDIQTALEEISGYDEVGLDLMYHQRSGDKELSNLLDYLITQYGTETDDWEEFVAKSIIAMYKRKLLKLIGTYKIEYDAIKPYNMSLHDDLLSDHLDSESSRNSTTSGESTDKSSYQGFNSSEYSDVDKEDSTTKTDTESGDSYSRDRTSEREIERSGNIGNKSSQQLIEEEREMLKWNIYITIFSDIDKIMCARIWDTEIK